MSRDRIKEAKVAGVKFDHASSNLNGTYYIVGIDRKGQAVDVHPRATLSQVERAELLLRDTQEAQ